MAYTLGITFCYNVIFCSLLFYSTFHLLLADEIVKPGTDEGKADVFHFNVNIKRLKREVHTVTNEDESPLEGRTHRASEPLDPNKPFPVVSPFEDFETVNKIFEPTVEGEDDGGGPDKTDEPQEYAEASTEASVKVADSREQGYEEEQNEIPRDNGDRDDNDVNNIDDNGESRNADGRQYAAQYPYPQSQSGQYEAADDGDDTPRRFYPGDLDQPPYQRGLVLPYGRDPQRQNQTRQYNSGTRYQNGDGGSRVYSQQTFTVGESGNVTSRYQSGTRQYPGNSRRVPETRGPVYNGRIYLDSRGNYVDAQGRRLDPTGRYYDTRGYQDAVDSRTRYYDTRPAYPQSSRDAVDRNNQYPGTRTPSRGAPLDSYGGNQFYQTGSGSYPVSYDPVVSQISDDPNCADMNVQVTINGLPCNNAVSQIGSFVCYNYERVSTECCQRCLAVKRRERQGCEYGDRSNQCRNIQPFNCYDDRNRQICCDRCRQFLDQRGQGATIYQSREQLVSRCSFDDLTPRCNNIRQRPFLCYLPENQRLCCSTCPRLANNAEPACQWGDQSPELCEPFDANRRLKLDCYIEAVRNICCATCKSLRERMPQQVAGCEYGDAPTLFRTGRGLLNCGEFIRQYGGAQCNSFQTSRKCCYTCQRYRSRRQGK